MTVPTREAHTWFQDAFRHAPVGMALIGPDGCYLDVNEALCLLLGRPVEDVLGRSPLDHAQAGDLARAQAALAGMLDGTVDNERFELRFERPDTTVVHLAYLARCVRDDGGKPVYLYCQTLDLTECYARTAALAVFGRRALTRATVSSLRTEATNLVAGLVDLDTEHITQLLAGAMPPPPELSFEDREFVASVASILDAATARLRAESETWRLAMHDGLTGLANRVLLTECIDDALVELQPGREHVALLALDVDGFKRVNDSLGHSHGDALLRDLGRRIADAVRPSDTVARLGGDEFAVLIRGLVHPSEAEMVAHRVLDALRAPFAVGGRAVHIGASVGIACVGSRSVDADDLLADADLAMYAAKAAGKGKAVTFNPNLRKAAVGQLALEEDLRYAATRGLFRLDYQPVVELATGAFIGGEALIRWPHPTRGMVPPLDFIPLAEDTGLVVPLGSWVLEQACLQGAAWRRMLSAGDQAHAVRAGAFTMNVNVSSRQVVEPDFVSHVAAVLERTEIDPQSVVLEMTESVFMADDAHSRRVMSGLRDLGVRIAIDDFGTGYSSLAYLRRLPIDILKLDRSFVTDLADGSSERVITSAVVEIAHQLDLMVIAEGIETTEQLQLLVELGCTAGQGYLLHRPMPAEAFTERLLSR